MVFSTIAINAQTNHNGKPVNPTQPNTAQPNTTVTPNMTVPPTQPRIPSKTATTSQTVNAIKPQDTMTPAGTNLRPIKNDTKPSTINGNANTNQHVTTPGNTKTDNTEIDHTQPSGTQRVDGTTVTPPKK